MELWKDIAGLDGDYQISNLGRIRSFMRLKITGHVMKPNPNPGGYLKVNIHKKGKQKTLFLHQLVAQHFIENPEGKRCACHKDNDKTNNAAGNLFWGTHAENSAQARNDGIGRQDVPVYAIKDGIVIWFPSQMEAERQTGISTQNMRHCLAGRHKTAGGFTWTRAEKRKDV